jgi:hypothetical protein
MPSPLLALVGVALRLLLSLEYLLLKTISLRLRRV